MHIMTANGWKQLCPRHNDMGQPTVVPPLKADGKHVPYQDPLDYNSCGRFIGERPSEGFVIFITELAQEARELTEFRIARHGHDNLASSEEYPQTFDRWGVAVKVF